MRNDGCEHMCVVGVRCVIQDRVGVICLCVLWVEEG